MIKQGCSQHVFYQLPNKHVCVGYLLDAIKSENIGLQVNMANVEDDTGVGGKRKDFERASAHFLPKDLVIKKKNVALKRPSADICDSTMNQTKKRNGKKWDNNK